MACLLRCSTLLEAIKTSRPLYSLTQSAMCGTCSINLLPYGLAGIITGRRELDWGTQKSVCGSFACPRPPSEVRFTPIRAHGTLSLGGGLLQSPHVSTCTDCPSWALQKVEEKCSVTKHLTVSEFLDMWKDPVTPARDNDLNLELARQLVHKGYVLQHGNTVFLEGDKLAATVEKSLPWSSVMIENKLAELKCEMTPLEKEKSRLEKAAYARARWIMLAGLTALVAQFAAMYQLTYVVYSWEETEPVAYFMRYGLSIGAYVYFLKASRLCGYSTVYTWLGSRKLKELYTKTGFDIRKYQRLKNEIETWERYARSARQH